MEDLEENNRSFWSKVRTALLNKYAITLVIFAIIMLFVGNRSIINRVERASKIREKEQVRDEYIQKTQEVRSAMETLRDSDNLQRFAREHYYMHTSKEDVYLVDE